MADNTAGRHWHYNSLLCKICALAKERKFPTPCEEAEWRCFWDMLDELGSLSREELGGLLSLMMFEPTFPNVVKEAEDGIHRAADYGIKDVTFPIHDLQRHLYRVPYSVWNSDILNNNSKVSSSSEETREEEKPRLAKRIKTSNVKSSAHLKKQRTCFRCGKPGHIVKECKREKSASQ